jgi:hypothetical protein
MGICTRLSISLRNDFAAFGCVGLWAALRGGSGGITPGGMLRATISGLAK